MIRIYSKYQ